MRPVNNRNFGADAGRIRVRYNNGTSVVTGRIVRQVGTTRFVVEQDNGSNRRVIRLAATSGDAANPPVGFGTIRAFRPQGSGAVFTPVYEVASVSITAGGTGYSNGNVTVSGGSGTSATLNITTSGGAVVNVAVVGAGDYLVMPGTQGAGNRTGVTVTGGGGSGATFTLILRLKALTLDAAGSGYLAGQALVFTGGQGTLAATISTVDGSGAITGTSITQRGAMGAPITAVAGARIQDNVRVLRANRALLVSGTGFFWNLGAAPAEAARAGIEII